MPGFRILNTSLVIKNNEIEEFLKKDVDNVGKLNAAIDKNFLPKNLNIEYAAFHLHQEYETVVLVIDHKDDKNGANWPSFFIHVNNVIYFAEKFISRVSK